MEFCEFLALLWRAIIFDDFLEFFSPTQTTSINIFGHMTFFRRTTTTNLTLRMKFTFFRLPERYRWVYVKFYTFINLFPTTFYITLMNFNNFHVEKFGRLFLLFDLIWSYMRKFFFHFLRSLFSCRMEHWKRLEGLLEH